MAEKEAAELYRRHRPTTLKEIKGQPGAVKMLREFFKAERVPHAILLTGPSGCGKTTLARIARERLECGDHDYSEINAADFRGVDTIRDIRSRMNLSPMSGKVRVWVIDEAHKLTNDAQSALLKMLEDTPKHVYFMLCTTDPMKLMETIRTRCTEIKVQSLPKDDMQTLVNSITAAEGKRNLTDEVFEQLYECSGGSARKGLVLLGQIIDLPEGEDQIRCLVASDKNRKAAFELVKAMLWRKTTWVQVTEIIKSIDEEHEKIRHLILSCANTELLKGNGNSARANLVIQMFRDPFYEWREAGLAASCYSVMHRD